MKRTMIGVGAIVAVVLACVVYVVASARPAPTGTVDLTARDSLLYVTEGRLAQRTGSSVVVSDRPCARVYSAGGTTVCLRSVAVPPSYEAVLYGPDFAELHKIKLDGTPSRTRVSASGNLVGWTVFRSGDSYMPSGYFSTTAGIYDRRSGTLYGSMEDFTSIVDGVENHAKDRNFWGVTFGLDDRTFYATLASGGRTWLMKGDLSSRTLVSVRENAECPSVSPDGKRVAYKKRSGEHWSLAVLDLATGVETPLAERNHLDDQAVWLDDRTIGYARPPAAGEPLAIFAVPADGTGEPRLVQADASSPSPLGQSQSQQSR
ncbi:TolB family protein [Actinokineospora sp. HUAS TT18]|uniref:TolB family protein n=1 Tax=Actinokineospora sp. HUAS TT18 TaxID=3447451 RepID=UPI003F521558